MRVFRRAFRWILGAVGALAILLALSIVAVRVLLLQVPQQQAQIQEWINRATGLDLRLTKLSARWGVGGPEIYATGIEVYAPDGGPRLARAQGVSVSTDIKRMLMRSELLTGRVRLIGPEVRLVRTANGLQLEGDPRLPRRREGGPMNSDALPSGSLEIVDGRITITDGENEIVRIQGVNLSLQRDSENLRFDGALELPRRMGGELAFNGHARGRLDAPDELQWQMSVAGQQVHLASWGEFLSGRWRDLNPRGEIKTLRLAVSGEGMAHPRFRLTARFNGVGIDPVGRVPGLSGLSGEVAATEISGEAQVEAADFVIDMPYRFREPLAAAVSGRLAWSRLDEPVPAWRFVGHEMRAHSPHGEVSGEGELIVPGDGSSRLLKLQAQFRNAAVGEVWRYIPYDRVRNPRTLAWLDAAFLDGRALSGEVRFDGPTRRFPFREGEGEFYAHAVVDGVRLHYAEGWPQLEQLAGEVEFHNAGMNARLEEGRVYGLRIAPGATAQVADFKLAELSVKAKASGDLGAGLRFLQNSPLAEKLGAQFARLRGAGPMAARLDLFLPIRERERRSFTVLADLGSASRRTRLNLAGSPHELDQLRGRLRVEDGRLMAKGLQASYLDGPVTIDLEPQPPRGALPAQNVVYLRARTPAEALAHQFNAPAKVQVGGELDWRGVVRITPGGENKRPEITARIDSDLTGVTLEMPAPLTKAASESRPVRLDLRWPAPEQMRVQLRYGSLLQGQLSFGREAGEWRLARGSIQLGEGRMRTPPPSGLFIGGRVDQLDLSGWLALRSERPGRRRLADYLRGVELNAGNLRWYGFNIPDVHATLYAGARSWAVRVRGPRSEGQVLVPFDLESSEPLLITLSKLDLGEPDYTVQAAQGRDRPDPRRWPPVRIAVGDFSAFNKQFGFLRAQLTPVPEGLRLESLRAESPSFVLTGTGSWIVAGAGEDQHGRLGLSLQSRDVLQTLQKLGYGASLAGRKGMAELDLAWEGPPDGRLLSRVHGTMHVEVDDGQLVTVQPGAGRVFGLMSLTTLRRRLALDFSDLTDKGLSFDSIRGDFTLRDGNAYTSNLLLRGPAAEIGVVGRTGIEARDYDQTAVVTGNFGESLPMAGALAGGPAVGAALLVFSQIFKQPLKGVARGYYRITGPWEDPVVERVDAEDVKKAEGAARQMQGSAAAGAG